MKAGLFAFAMLLMTAGASHAGGLVTRHQSSLQHTVDPTRTITSEPQIVFAVHSGVTMDSDVSPLTAADLVVGGLGTLQMVQQQVHFGTHIKQLLVRHSLTVILLLQVMLPMQLEL